MTALDKPTILYLTYDGLLEPLGQSQVLAYMEKLASEWPVHIVSFEKTKDRRDKARMETMGARLAASGISWTPLTYHKSPSIPATAYDIAQGALVVFWLALRRRAAIVHVRSYIPGLIALPTKRSLRVRSSSSICVAFGPTSASGWRIRGRMAGASIARPSISSDFSLESADHIVTHNSSSPSRS